MTTCLVTITVVHAEPCTADDLCCRQPGTYQHAQSAAGSSKTAPVSCQAPYVNLEDTYNECMGSISEAGAAFQATLCPDGVQGGVTADILQSWADPDSQK